MTNGGILDLLMRYLKAVGQKFLEEWPRGLAAVVLEVYQTWRKHSSGLPNPLLRDCSNQHIRVNKRKTETENISRCTVWEWSIPVGLLWWDMKCQIFISCLMKCLRMSSRTGIFKWTKLLFKVDQQKRHAVLFVVKSLVHWTTLFCFWSTLALSGLQFSFCLHSISFETRTALLHS